MTRSFKGSLDRRTVVEAPTLTRLTDAGLVNHGFDSFTQAPSPSFFYIDTRRNSWLDNSYPHHYGSQQSVYNPSSRRFTESWIELEQAYSCGSSSVSSKGRCSRCCTKCIRTLIYALIALCVLGFMAIIAAILYMEVFHAAFAAKAAAASSANFSTTTSAPAVTLSIDIADSALNETLASASNRTDNSTVRSTTVVDGAPAVLVPRNAKKASAFDNESADEESVSGTTISSTSSSLVPSSPPSTAVESTTVSAMSGIMSSAPEIVTGTTSVLDSFTSSPASPLAENSTVVVESTERNNSTIAA